MLTPSEQHFTAKTTSGELKISVNRLPDGRYQLDATFFDKDGYYDAGKSSTRIVDTFDELLIGNSHN
jgi:hypothetical protein